MIKNITSCYAASFRVVSKSFEGLKNNLKKELLQCLQSVLPQFSSRWQSQPTEKPLAFKGVQLLQLLSIYVRGCDTSSLLCKCL